MASLPKPFLIGRTLRVLAGLYLCYWAFAILELPIELGELVGAIFLGLLGLSLILGGPYRKCRLRSDCSSQRYFEEEVEFLVTFLFALG